MSQSMGIKVDDEYLEYNLEEIKTINQKTSVTPDQLMNIREYILKSEEKQRRHKVYLRVSDWLRTIIKDVEEEFDYRTTGETKAIFYEEHFTMFNLLVEMSGLTPQTQIPKPEEITMVKDIFNSKNF
jgi:hypothetical protein